MQQQREAYAIPVSLLEPFCIECKSRGLDTPIDEEQEEATNRHIGMALCEDCADEIETCDQCGDQQPRRNMRFDPRMGLTGEWTCERCRSWLA